MVILEEFVGKSAIVTGAGRGMGKTVSERLAALGVKVIVNDYNSELANDTVESIKRGGGDAVAASGDVSLEDDVRRVVENAMDWGGPVQILINNAGVLMPTKVIDIDEKEWDKVVGVNLKGTYLFSRAILPSMQRSGWGRIVNFSSTAGKNVSTIGGAHYTAAKAGILGFTRHLAKEVAHFGITVNAVCPGLINTEMVRSTINPDQLEDYAKKFPIPRIGEPEEVADLVIFLVSDKSRYITGASLDINGGDLMV